jgi:hypothetical protein
MVWRLVLKARDSADTPAPSYDWRGEAQQKGTFRPLRAAQEKLRGAA